MIRTYTLSLAPFTLAGILLGTGLSFEHLWWATFLGILLILHMFVQPPERGVVVGMVGAGVIKGGIATMWFFSILPADWLGNIPTWKQVLLITFCWSGTALSLGLPFLLIGYAAYLFRTYPLPQRLIFLALLLCVSDILGALFFSLYTWNSNVELTTTFGFGFTGYSLAYHQLLRPLAAFGGVYALTFSLTAIALCTILLRQYLAAHKRDYALVVVCAVFIGTAYLPWYNTTPHEGIAVAALQSRFEARTYFSDYEMSLRKQELRNAIKFALSENVEVIALPEDSRLGYGVPNIVSQLQYEAVGSAPIIVDSYRTMTSSTSVVQRAYLYDLKTGATYTTDKSALVPMGEFIPVLHALVLRALHGTSFFKDMYYVPGAHEIPGTAPPTVPHVLFCFEGGAAHIAKRKTLMRASSLIVHPVSHAWFHKPHTLWHQTRSMLIVQSIYTGVPILQSGNMAPSLLYTPDGGVHTGTSTKTSSRVTLHTFVI